MQQDKEIDTAVLRQKFVEHFGGSADDENISVFFCPGRVNLIGEYTDFTGGLVFPCAINRGTKLLVRRSHNHTYRFASTNDEYVGSLSHAETEDRSQRQWIRYPTGIINQFHLRDFDVDGVDLLYSGNIPSGAGLSSSASIGVVTALALNTLFGCELDKLSLVKLAQRSENDFVGTQCGIMDQFAVAMGEPDHVLYLNCGSLDYRSVPMKLGSLSFVIADTKQVRENSESAYNDRVSECAQALELLKSVVKIDQLGDLSPQTLREHESLFENHPLIAQRVQHVAMENERVRSAVPALEQSDFQQFGHLMNASHDSLRDLFEVSSEPLEHMIRLSRSQPGVLGSRLTGAGFGGCTISLMETDAVTEFTQTVATRYRDATSLDADFYSFRPSAGARQLA